MSQDLVMKLSRDTLQITLMLSAPLLIVSLVVGIAVSVMQVVTSIQDMTLSLIPKMLAVFVVFLIMLPWALHLLVSFSAQLYCHLEQFAL